MQTKEAAQKETVYLAGKITGDPFYWSKFAAAQYELEKAGYVVLNPANQPQGFAYEAYIRMSRAMQDECQSVCFLPDWKESIGAQGEYGRAIASGQRVFFYDAWQTAQAEAIRA